MQRATSVRHSNLLTLNIHDITGAEDSGYDGLDETFGAGAFRLSTNGRDFRLRPRFVSMDGTECDTAEEAEQQNAELVQEIKEDRFVLSLLFGGINALASAASAESSKARAYGGSDVAAQLMPQSNFTSQTILIDTKFANQSPQQQLEFIANTRSFSCPAPISPEHSILSNDALLNSFSIDSLTPGFIDDTPITKVTFQKAAIGSVLNKPAAPLSPFGPSLLLPDTITSGASFMDLADPQPRPH